MVFIDVVVGGYRMFARVFPRCSMISLAVALATTRIGGKTSLLELIQDLTEFLPPGSQGLVSEFLVKRGPDAWKIVLVGWTGTLLAGSQVMKLVMEGIHIIYGDKEMPGFLHRQLRGAALATLFWWLVDVLFGIYVRRVPYSVVYGGLAAVIGLIIWMQLSAVIIFLGAAWNAELADRRRLRNA